MGNKLGDKLKRGLLYLSVPLALGCGSCTINKNYIDDVYYSPPKKEISLVQNNLRDPTIEEDNWDYSKNLKIQDSLKENPSRTEVNIYLEDDFDYSYRFNRFRDPLLRFNSGWGDSDGDGVDNWADPWPYNFGPYLDVNGNGIIDFQDVKVSGFGHDFWDYDFNYHYSPWYGSYYGYGYGYYGGGFYDWDSPFYYHHNYWNYPWWAYDDWNDNDKPNNNSIYGHRNTATTDGSATKIYKEISNGDLIKRTTPQTSTRTYTRPETSSAARAVSPQNKTNASSSARTTTQYRTTNPTRTNTSSNSGAVRTYTPPARSSSNTIQRSGSSSSSSSSAIRSGSSSSSSSGATRSSSTTSSSSGASRTVRR